MRKILTSLLELAGLASITAGAALVYRPAGLIVGGLAAVAVGYMEGE